MVWTAAQSLQGIDKHKQGVHCHICPYAMLVCWTSSQTLWCQLMEAAFIKQ